MTVGNLIKRLQRYDPKTTVLIEEDLAFEKITSVRTRGLWIDTKRRYDDAKVFDDDRRVKVVVISKYCAIPGYPSAE